MNIETLSQECLQKLQLALEDAFATNKNSDERTAFVYRHAITIKRLGEDVIHLEADGRHYSSAIIVRSMLECLFNLVAAVENVNFAAEKLVWEVENEVKNLLKWIEVEHDDEPNFAETINELESLSSALRQKQSISSPLNWNVFECAKAAGLVGNYRREYFMYSRVVHATASGIIGREQEIGRGHILKTVLFALIYATGTVVQVIPTKNPQSHIDAAAKLTGKLITLIDSGSFGDLDNLQ